LELGKKANYAGNLELRFSVYACFIIVDVLEIKPKNVTV